MPSLRICLLFTMITALPTIAPAFAQDKIVGQDAMGDKGRSGPDGWSWAPMTRSQVPGDHGTTNAGTPNTMPDPGAGRTLPAGEDPGTPAVAQAKGPGALDKPAGEKPAAAR